MTDEAKRCVVALRTKCREEGSCDACGKKYWCYLHGDEELSDHAADLIESLSAELEQVKRERDALMKDVSGYCSTCAFLHDCAKHDLNDSAPFSRWYYGDCEDWQWRGAKEESDG